MTRASLGRLEPDELRDIWTSEAAEFTGGWPVLRISLRLAKRWVEVDPVGWTVSWAE